MKQTKLNSANLSPSSTFIGGAQHADKIGHYINCSNNPCDLRRPTDIILDVAYEMRKTLPDDQPLVILMGEPHSMPSRLELQHLVASRLLDDDQKFTVNIEWEHNYWSKLAQYGMEIDVPSRLYYNPEDYDPNGQALLSAFLGFGGFGNAPISYNNLLAFCHDKEISTIFNCPTLNESYALDLKDDFTASITKDFLQTENIEGLKLTRDNPENMRKCMAISNFAMASRGVEHARKHSKNIILQQVGLNHVFGNEQEGCRYKTSLSPAYHKAGAAVLSVFSTIRADDLGLNILPEAAHQELAKTIVIDGLSEKQFGLPKWWKFWSNENRFIHQLHKKSGRELEFYDVAAQKKQYQRIARANAQKLLQRYNHS